MSNPNAKPGERKLQLPGNVLGTIIEVTGVKFSTAHDNRAESIFHNTFFLGIIKSGRQDKTGMIINC